MSDSDWMSRNTYHHSAFADLDALVRAKRERGLKISVCFPTLNEEATIGKELVVVKSELQDRRPLVDEIVVIDSGSKDRTLEIARSFGVAAYDAESILPDLPPCRGKGENLWKALHVLEGDIVVYLDADIKNIHPRFAYGLLGPLLLRKEVKFSKAFYERPMAFGARGLKPTGGGRVTELVIRPLFSLYYPELAQLLQPLSGEYAAYREALEGIPFPVGYGIETSMLIDLYRRYGMDAIAQVDLDRRVHRNQDTKALGRMSFGIMRTFFRKLAESGGSAFPEEVSSRMIQYRLEEGAYVREEREIDLMERPPIESVPEYRERRAAQARARLGAKGGKA